MYGEQGFAPLRALTYMLVSNTLIQNTAPHILAMENVALIVTTAAKKLKLYIVLVEAISTDRLARLRMAAQRS